MQQCAEGNCLDCSVGPQLTGPSCSSAVRLILQNSNSLVMWGKWGVYYEQERDEGVLLSNLRPCKARTVQIKRDLPRTVQIKSDLPRTADKERPSTCECGCPGVNKNLLLLTSTQSVFNYPSPHEVSWRL